MYTIQNDKDFIIGKYIYTIMRDFNKDILMRYLIS